jgi:hypothetical protein
MHESLYPILDLVLPEGLKEYFELKTYQQSDEEIHIYIEELNNQPEGYEKVSLTSKGFFKEVVVQDFPLRGKQVFMHIKRRRWIINETNEVVFRDWSLVAKGTRITKDFATFLKEIHRFTGL